MKTLSALLLYFVAFSCPAQQLWGITNAGGEFNAGTIYRVNKDGTSHEIVKSFRRTLTAPHGELTPGTGNVLYGMSPQGGAHNKGGIFRVNEDGTGFTVLHHFNGVDGAIPIGACVPGKDGRLYGTTSQGGIHNGGVVFRINIDGTGFQKLHDFSSEEGVEPGSLVSDNLGNFFGVTVFSGPAGRGAIFKISSDGTVFEILHAFNDATVSATFSSLILDEDGMLYGIGPKDQPGVYGAIYRIRTDGIGYTEIHRFTKLTNSIGSRLCVGSDKRLYGFTGEGIFSINKDGTGYTVHVNDADMPYNTGSLVEVGEGVFYAVSYSGVFKLHAPSNEVTTVYSFTNNERLLLATSQLVVNEAGMLFGSIPAGGGTGAGFIFSIDSSSGDLFRNVFDFNPEMEAFAPKRMIRSRFAGEMYGITSRGGREDCGTLFKIDKDGNYKKLYDFSYNTGCRPQTLMQSREGDLWGVVQVWEGNYYGAVFRFSPDAGDYNIATEFNSTIGSSGEANFAEDEHGNLYSSTPLDNEGGGEVFRINKVSHQYEKLHQFIGYNDLVGGSRPHGELVISDDGFLYGRTYAGGANGKGLFYKMNIDGSAYSKIYDFSENTGSGPSGASYLDADGVFYGVTDNGGGYGKGVLYKVEKDGSNYQILHSFIYGPFWEQEGIVADTANSNLFGTTRAISNYSGNIFSYSIEEGTYREILVFNGENGADPIGPPIFFGETVTSTSERPTNTVSIHPNPATRRIFITGTDRDATVIAFDATGRALPLSLDFDRHSQNKVVSAAADISGLAAGLYIVRVISGSHAQANFKLVVRP